MLSLSKTETPVSVLPVDERRKSLLATAYDNGKSCSKKPWGLSLRLGFYRLPCFSFCYSD